MKILGSSEANDVNEILKKVSPRKFKYPNTLKHHVRFRYVFVIWVFLVALSIYFGYLAATQVVTEDTKTFEFWCSQNFVKEVAESPSLNQNLEVSLFNDLTLISFERDKTLLALSCILQREIPEDFRSSYFEIILYNEEGWGEEFLRSKPKYDFPSGDGHVRILKDIFGNPEVCDVIYKETEYCIFVPLKNAVIEKNHFLVKNSF